MTIRNDRKIGKWWREGEFRCRCRAPDCSAKPMRPEFIRLLDELRELWGKPLLPTSGSRCSAWNLKIAGSPFSQHLQGNAVDFWFTNPRDTEKLVELAEKIGGFGGIGQGRHLLHLDGREGPQKRWEYPNQ